MGSVVNAFKPVATTAGATQIKSSSSEVASDNLYDVIIIGGGPSAMTASIYCARKKLKTLMLTKDLGGQAAWSSDVENYLGFSMISGADLTKHFQDHVQEFSDEITLKFVTKGVTSVQKVGNEFCVKTGDGAENMGRAVICASGRQPRKLGIEGEDKFLNKGITYCAWCDGPLFRDKSVAIIGGGNSALDAGLSMQKIARNITIINVGTELNGDEVMIEKIIGASNIRVLNNSRVLAIAGERQVQSLTVRNMTSGLDSTLPVEGVLIEIGSTPSTDYLEGVVELNSDGEIIIDKNNMTSVPGIFASGDVTDILEKQIIISAGEGAKASIACAKWLATKP